MTASAPPRRSATATILYDATCGLCDRSVRFIRQRDRLQYFAFAPLDSEAGRALFHGFSNSSFPEETLILLEDGRVWTRSTAILRICRRLPGGWRLFYLLILAPRRWRDRGYDAIARNRRRWFKTWCPPPAAAPSAKEKEACDPPVATRPKTPDPH